MGEVSPPDADGFRPFSAALRNKREPVARARIAVTEGNDRLIRACGENCVHVSEIDLVVERPMRGRRPADLAPEGGAAAVFSDGLRVA